MVPGDFNGDSVMDLLIVSRESDHYKMSLFLGNKNSKITNNLRNLLILKSIALKFLITILNIQIENEIVLKYKIIDQPFIAE